jgi:hypothetical protein
LWLGWEKQKLHTKVLQKKWSPEDYEEDGESHEAEKWKRTKLAQDHVQLWTWY